jgi:hypothetical protein
MSMRERLRSSAGSGEADGNLTPLVVGICSAVGAFAGSTLAGSAVGVGFLAALGALAGGVLVWFVVRVLA